MAYIIYNDTPIATVSNDHKSGSCEFGYNYVKESMNANFDEILVNRKKGKVSHNKKWDRYVKSNNMMLNYGIVLDEYYPRDFLINTTEG